MLMRYITFSLLVLHTKHEIKKGICKRVVLALTLLTQLYDNVYNYT